MFSSLPILSYDGESAGDNPPSNPPPATPSPEKKIDAPSSAPAPAPVAPAPSSSRPAKPLSSVKVSVGVKERERAVNQVCLELSSRDVKSPEELWRLCLCATSTDFMEICEERALADRCGFPMCSNPFKKAVLKPSATVVHKDDVTLAPGPRSSPDFCSFNCAQKAVQFAQLLGDPISAMDRFKKLSGGSTAAAPTAAAPIQAKSRLEITGEAEKKVSVPVVPWGPEAGLAPHPDESGRQVGASSEEQPSTSTSSAAPRKEKEGQPPKKKGILKKTSSIKSEADAPRQPVMQTTVVERTPVAPVSASAPAPKQHTVVESYVPKERGVRSRLTGPPVPHSFDPEPAPAPLTSSSEANKPSKAPVAAPAAPATIGGVDAAAIDRLIDAFWKGASVEDRSAPFLTVDALTRENKKGKGGRKGAAVRDEEDEEWEEDEDEEGREGYDYPEGSEDEVESESDGLAEDQDGLESGGESDQDGNESDFYDEETEEAFERRLALLEQWSTVGAMHFLSRPPHLTYEAEEEGGPGTRRGRTQVDENGCEYRIKGESDEEEEETEADVAEKVESEEKDSAQGHQIRIALNQKMASAVPKVLRAAGCAAPVQPIQTALEALLKKMRFRMGLPSLSTEDGNVICTALVCALTRYHLPGLQEVFGMPPPVIGEEESSLIIKLRPAAQLVTALKGWKCGRGDLEALVETLFGGVGF